MSTTRSDYEAVLDLIGWCWGIDAYLNTAVWMAHQPERPRISALINYARTCHLSPDPEFD